MDYLLAGERVGLGPLRRDLIPQYTRWVNDPAVFEGTGHAGAFTEDAEGEWFEKQSAASAERVPEAVTFTVHDLSDDAPVGTAGLFAINHLYGTATYGIALGERRGQGLGTETTRLVLRYAFETLGLHNVMLTALAWNEQAIAAYRRAGFEDLGVRRQAVWSRGERVDEVLLQAVRPG
jgi:RimJ/RimL family protein N-acetyltransferase